MVMYDFVIYVMVFVHEMMYDSFNNYNLYVLFIFYSILLFYLFETDAFIYYLLLNQCKIYSSQV